MHLSAYMYSVCQCIDQYQAPEGEGGGRGEKMGISKANLYEKMLYHMQLLRKCMHAIRQAKYCQVRYMHAYASIPTPAL